MAKYEGTYACGHDGVVNVIGKMRDRQRKIDYAFSHLCPKCAKKEREKQIAEENKNSEVLSKEYEFPELAGSEKQVAWANTIRLDFYNEYEDYLAIQEMIENETAASFWLDLDRFVSKKDFLRKYERTKKEKERRDRIIDIDAVAPEDLQYKGVVEIVKKLDKICLFYMKNQDFIDLAKTKGYRWNEDDCCWYRRLNEETEKYAIVEDKYTDTHMAGGVLITNYYIEVKIGDQKKSEKIQVTYEQYQVISKGSKALCAIYYKKDKIVDVELATTHRKE